MRDWSNSGSVPLKLEFEAQLDGATASRTDDRVGRGYIWSGTSTAEPAAPGHRWIIVSPAVLAAVGVSEIGVVDDVEDLTPELRTIAIVPIPHLVDREIPVLEA